MKSRRLWIGFSLVAAAIAFGPFGIALIMALQVAPLPSLLTPLLKLLHGLTFVFPLVWLAIALCSPVFSIVAFFKTKLRPYLIIFLFVWLVSWLSVPIGWRLNSLRNLGLKRITQQAQPLVRAIETFRVQSDAYPTNLTVLVPTFLTEIPRTGAVGYPEFRYSLADDKSLFRDYELLVRTPTGGINWDVFVFWPEKNYPTNMYGGHVERIGDWAYVHE